jgi:hypothetical protein
MLIRKVVTLLLIILICTDLLYAQRNPERLSGKWQITKVEMKLFTQQDNRLLEAKTFTADSAIRTINARVPVNIQFEGVNYVMRFRGAMESGIYSTQDSLMLLREGSTEQSKTQQASLPAIPYKYFFKNDTLIGIEMPASYYKDNNRNLAVRLACTCYYSKKK